MRYNSWDTEYGVRQNFFVILGHFLSFYPLPPPPSNNPENQNFEKMEKASEDVTILNLCNKKHDMECNMQFLVILGYFLLFYPAVDLEN